MPVLLLLIGIILILYSTISLKKEKLNNQSYKNDSFNLVFNNSQKELNDYKYELGIVRKDIGESLAELQNEILDIKSEISQIKENGNYIDNNMNKDYYDDESNMAEKAKSIKELLDAGRTDEEICKELDVGKGEVLLVKGLYK